MNRQDHADSDGSHTRFGLFPIACLLFFLLPILACLGLRPLRWELILLRAPDLLLLALWLAAGAGYGALILRLGKFHHEFTGLLRIVVAIALGLGLMSLLILLTGLCIRMTLPLAWGMLAVGWIAAFANRDVFLIPKNDQPIAGPYRWLLLLCAAALGLACITALLPPGVLWGDEPNGYDVLEYHLQIPREWYQLGRIVQLHHNVFSYFPFNVEMHYLLAMGLRGGPWAGMYLAQLMHVAFIALTVLAIYASIAERSTPMAIIAATAAATVPWLGLLAPIAYNEGGLLLWGTLAISLSLRGSNWRTMALAGAMAGFACGSKLTAVPIVLLALPIVQVAILRNRVSTAAIYLLAGALTFSPWLVKNAVWTGNPIFPEGTAIFGSAHWSPTQVQRWIRANHLPRPDQQNLDGRAAAAWHQVLGDWRFGYALIPLALIAAALAWRDRKTRALVAMLLTLAVFWMFFTHLQSRFFTLGIPLSALLIGQIEARKETLAACSIIVALMAFGGLFSVIDKVTSIKEPIFDFLGVENLTGLTPLTDTTVPPDARVVLLGDAKAFLYDVPVDRLFYRTVFDVDAKPGEPSEDAWRAGLKSWNGSTIDVIDAPELRRFARTYWGIPQPSDEVMQMAQPTVRQ